MINPGEDESAPTEAEIDAEVARLAAEQDQKRQVVIYSDVSVNPEDGTITVTPELIDSLLQDYLFDAERTGTHTEGDIRIRVKYEDFKRLLEQSGKVVVELNRDAMLSAFTAANEGQQP